MRQRGFTLVEVVVAIGIIILMAGLVLSVSVVVVQGAEARETEQVIKLLEQAVLDWEATTGRQVSWGTDGVPFAGSVFDMQETTDPVFRITELLNTIGRVEGVKSIIANINPDFVHVYERQIYPPWLTGAEQSAMDTTWAIDNTSGIPSLGLAVLDAWGAPILAVHPGRVRDAMTYPGDATAEADEDGTLHTVGPYSESVCGAARNRQILFVSAGPDGEFGNVDPSSPEHEAARDNVTSYEPQLPP